MAREHVREEIEALIARGNITVEEDTEIRCNSYERQAMVPALTDTAFLWRIRHCIANCFFSQRVPAPTYNEALGSVYVPELIHRYESLMKTLKGMVERVAIPARAAWETCPKCGMKEPTLHVKRLSKHFEEIIGCDGCLKPTTDLTELLALRALLTMCGITPEGSDPADGGPDRVRDLERIQLYVKNLQDAVTSAWNASRSGAKP